MGRANAKGSQSPVGDGPFPAVVLDLVAVLLFVGIGRLSHGEPLSPSGFWTTAWPFLIGLGGGYVGLVVARLLATSLLGGCLVAGKTIVLGLVIRWGIQRNDAPLAFILVTAVVISALMIGWRAVLSRRAGSASSQIERAA